MSEIASICLASLSVSSSPPFRSWHFWSSPASSWATQLSLLDYLLCHRAEAVRAWYCAQTAISPHFHANILHNPLSSPPPAPSRARHNIRIYGSVYFPWKIITAFHKYRGDWWHIYVYDPKLSAKQLFKRLAFGLLSSQQAFTGALHCWHVGKHGSCLDNHCSSLLGDRQAKAKPSHVWVLNKCPSFLLITFKVFFM